MYAQSNEIFSHHAPALVAKVEKINRRIARMFPDHAPLVLEFPADAPRRILKINTAPITSLEPRYVHVEKQWATLIGEAPVFPGWKFVAAYNFEKDADGGTVCFCDAMPGEVVGPQHREVAANTCEHCATKRFRKQSFLVENTETGERKVVGRSCIKDFTGHTDPARFIRAALSMGDLFGEAEGYGEERSLRGEIVEPVFDAREILEKSAATVRCLGWVSGKQAEERELTSSAWTLRFILSPEPPVGYKGCTKARDEHRRLVALVVVNDDDRAAADKALAALATAEDSDYIAKLKLIAAARVVSKKNFALWVSAITLHLKTVWAEEREARKTADREASSPVVEGRGVISGTILSLKVVSSQYGETLKMLVKDDRGFKLFGTVPAAIDDVEKGDRVTFTARAEASKDDDRFGFYSRPSKASKEAAA